MVLQIKNIEIQNKLSTLISLLSSNNAYFNENLNLKFIDKEFSIYAKKGHANLKKYIEIPIDLLPCIDDYEFELEEEQIVCKVKNKSITLQNDIMMIMVDIYNLSHKVSFHKQSNLFYNLKNHLEFLKLLTHSRKNEKIDKCLELLKNRQYSKLLMETFLSSRTFSYKKDNNQNSKQLILPVLDFLNHKITKKGFKIDKYKSTIAVETDKVESSSQLYVCYNYYDSLETLIYYGFSDISSPVLFSIPMKIPLSNGITIEIENFGFRKFSDEDVSKVLLPIKNLIPKIEKIDNKKIVVSKLAIPNKYLPLALRHVIHLILHELQIDSSAEVRLPILQAIEKYIIEENIRYYENLNQKTISIINDTEVSSYIKNQLKTLISSNIMFLKKYGSWFNNHAK